MQKILISSALILTLMTTTGCAPRGYAHSNLNQAMTVEPGVITSIKQVEINNDGVGNGLGVVLGSVAGGVVGNKVGGGTGKAIATAVGTVAGGVFGGMAGNQMDARYGVEVVVKLDNGKTVATVLPANGALSTLGKGQPVNVIYSSTGEISNVSPR
ncbi:Outer membrane lipoprotein [hydrothermal vent metagenome]|uniref:Outer membrane lipoprotein n=1 Tax=hydrothermal vent metagenome TaxID=652676 RepID=A0A1W1C839_9ZZZZ